jgi:hypothetical protein
VLLRNLIKASCIYMSSLPAFTEVQLRNDLAAGKRRSGEAGEIAEAFGEKVVYFHNFHPDIFDFNGVVFPSIPKRVNAYGGDCSTWGILTRQRVQKGQKVSRQWAFEPFALFEP